MEVVRMFLEGPGMERRPVKLLGTHNASLRTSQQVRPIIVEAQTLVDDEGKLAKQIDIDGFRFQYDRSPIIWSLLYG